MDSQKPSTRADIIAVIMGVPGWIALAVMFYFRYYPDPTKEPDIVNGALMTGWVPIVVLVAAQTLYMVGLLIVVFRRAKVKKLNEQVTVFSIQLGGVQRDYQTCKRNYDELEKEKNRLLNELAEATPNKRLISISSNDAAEIQEAVIVMGVYFRNEIENYKRYVDFWFQIFNMSVYDISIDDTLGDGDIIFNGHPLVSVKRIEDNKAINLPPRQPGTFTVRQFLDSGDIDAIKTASGDRRFEFHNLRIKVKGGAGFEHGVKEKRLKFSFGLSKDSPNYSNYNGPFLTQFNAAISGRINVVYFKTELDLINTVPLKDNRYVFYLILHTYIANHGAPTGIDNFRLAIRAGEEMFEGKRLPLTGCRWIRQGAEEDLSERDIESQNDATLTDVRRGWLQFIVEGVNEFEDDSAIEVVLDVIDKNNDTNRLNPIARARWIDNSMNSEGYINGPGIWQRY